VRWKIAFITLLILTGSVACRVLLRRGASAHVHQARLPDGTYAQIEEITFGKSHTFFKGNPIVAKLHQLAPGPLKNLFRAQFSTSFTMRDTEMLVLWYNRYDPATGTYPPANFDRFKIIDEHGCVFPINQYGGGGAGPGFSIGNAQARVFPRRQKTFKVRAHLPPGTNIEWIVENPFVTNPPAWKPEPLPLTRQQANIDFTLQKITGHFYQSGYWFQPKFKILHDGVDRTEWYKPAVTFIDATGNRDDNGLCPYEPVWKLEVDFYKSHQAPFADDQIWRLRQISVPRSGEVVLLGHTGAVASVSFHLIALCGPGEFSFSNDVCLASAEWAPEWQGESSSSSSADGKVETQFRNREPALLVQIEGLKSSRDLLVRWRDDQDRTFAADFRSNFDKIYRYELKVRKGAQKLDLEAIPQNPAKIEYIVEPPRPKPPSAPKS
jgi:hypothetical protein